MSLKRTLLSLSLSCLALPAVAFGQSARTGVDVGRHHANAHGSADGEFNFVDTQSRVGPGGNMGRAIAIGAGPNGLAISHSIGLGGGNNAVGHNFNMTIGPGGAHVSRGNVQSSGFNPRAIAGGGAAITPRGHVGGSNVTGFGNRVIADSSSRTINRPVGLVPGLLRSRLMSPPPGLSPPPGMRPPVGMPFSRMGRGFRF